MKRQTQYELIFAFLRKHGKATTWELSQAARSLSVHKRIAEMDVTYAEGFGYSNRVFLGNNGMITRRKVRKGKVWVTEYVLS
jgi:hypothetical protein